MKNSRLYPISLFFGAFALALFSLVLSCEQYDESVEADENEQLIEELAGASCSDNTRFVDAWGYKCLEWVGYDCLKAASDYGYTKSQEQQITRNCKKSCGLCSPGGDDNDCHTYPPHHSRYCTNSCPCNEGEGDCDRDSHCTPGLLCKQQTGTDYCVKPDNDTGIDGGIALNLRVHIMRDITMTVQGRQMTNDHISSNEVRNVIIPELNKIWKQGDIVWKIESIIDENVVKKSNFAQQKSIVENARRDANGRSDPARLPPLYSFMDPDYRSTQSELGANLFHIYIFPFIGNTSQGNAMRSFGFHTVVGSWSNKSNGGRVPIRRQFTENWSSCVKGSLARTIAHELGHVLTLTHSQCSNCLMKGCAYTLTSAQIAASQKEARKRSQ